jgi:uncharacterized membrane protein YidH (DUF202 family)
MSTSTLDYSTPSLSPTVVLTPTTSLVQLDISDSSNEVIALGTLGLLVTIAGVIAAALQLLRMRRRRKAMTMDVYDLA